MIKKIKISQEILKVAKSMINNDLNLIEGCRKITTLSHELGEERDGIYDFFEAIDSETDHLPTGHAFDNSSDENKERIEKELDAFLKDTASDILKHSRQLTELIEHKIATYE